MKVITLDESTMSKAFELCCSEISREEIIEALGSSDDVKKQICILKMEPPENIEEARALVSNLTGQDGIVREAVAVKLNEFVCPPDPCELLLNDEFLQTYSKALTDVNPNICRLIIDFIPYIPGQQKLFNLIEENVSDLLSDIENASASKNHVTTKKMFKLYWCLEAVYHIDEKAVNILLLNSIFDRVIKLDDYTILEKTAKIITKNTFFEEKFKGYKRLLSGHENFYVKSYFGG